MIGEKNLVKLIKEMTPILNDGEYIFATLKNANTINREDTICEFKEKEGTTIVIERKKADELKLDYHFIASWITLEIHSSLEAIGLTALFSKQLADNNISCNVVAGFYHDHIFVDKKDAQKAIKTLKTLSKNYQ